MYFLFSSILAGLLWCSSAVNAQYFAITGVQTGIQNGTRPFRRNIYDLQQNDPAGFALYVQGLARMQIASQNDPLSWLQVAGIHGRPYVPWNNSPYVPGAPAIGYCTHSSPLFATWHRPFLALIEQVLARHVQEIAQLYPPSVLSTYQAAADRFRIPYWDWANNPDLPPVTTLSTIQVTTPEGPRTINNPLFSFRFPRPLSQAQFPTNQDSGLSTYAETARNTPNNINGRLRTEGFQRRTWQSIARSRTFNTFSTSSTPGTSIEAVHNSVHGDINVHMGSLSYSAFDPIFWLHHTNVDRLTALYQCINPNTWLTTAPEPQGTFTIRQFQLVAGSTPLTPFTSTSSGQFYTSDSSRYLSTFGYAYPEITDWNQNPLQLQQSCTAHLNRLYNPTGSFFRAKKHKRSIRPRASGSIDLADIALDVLDSKEQKVRTWVVSVKVSKFDHPAPFIVRTFIGEPSTDPKDWFKDKGCFGSLYVNQPADTTGYYTSPQRDVVVHDEFDVEGALWERGLNGQNIEETKKFLNKKLAWRVQTHDGTVIPLEQMKSLKISVAEEMVTLAKSITELPTYGKRILHPDVTKGKIGGFQGTAAG